MIFHGVKGINLQEEDSPSWFNDHEIARVVRYISSLYSCGLKSDDIGIITPYQKQVRSVLSYIFRCFLSRMYIYFERLILQFLFSTKMNLIFEEQEVMRFFVSVYDIL